MVVVLWRGSDDTCPFFGRSAAAGKIPLLLQLLCLCGGALPPHGPTHAPNGAREWKGLLQEEGGVRVN